MATRKKVEEKMVSFVSIPPYQKGIRVYKGYTTRTGQARRWDEIELDDKGTTLKSAGYEAPRLKGVPGRMQYLSPHFDAVIEYLKEHPKCEGSPNLKAPAEFRLFDASRDREEQLASEEKVTRAKSIVFNMSEEQLLEFGASLNKIKADAGSIKQMALKMIEEEYDKFMEMFTANGNLKEFYRVQAMYYSALDPTKRIIEWRKDGTYFGDTRFGTSHEKSIRNLLSTEYQSVRSAIAEELKKKG